MGILGQILLFFYGALEGVFTNPWWLSIALLTIVVRSVMFPLTVKQVKSMRAMQDLRPDMEKLRNQYKDNPVKQREELGKLYQERQVNPLGGCLPILIQMPIFISIFYVIRQFGGYQVGDRTWPPSTTAFTHGGILWFQNLSSSRSLLPPADHLRSDHAGGHRDHGQEHRPAAALADAALPVGSRSSS